MPGILDALTDKALDLPPPPEGAEAGPAYGGKPLPYLAERLHLYLTLSNMRGVPYFVGFEGGQTRGHHMMCHGDRAHYILEGIGAHRGENKWLAEDDFDGLKITTAPRTDKTRDASYEDWQQYGRGAGVGGVSARARRAASRATSASTRRAVATWRIRTSTTRRTGGSWDKSHKYDFMSIDGGLIDNEPFEYARRAIMRDNEDNKTGENSVKGAVVMVDPSGAAGVLAQGDRSGIDLRRRARCRC